jgi:hypothetical protein
MTFRFPHENPAFNTPAKVAAIVMFLGIVGFGLTLIVAASQVHKLLTLVLAYPLFGDPFL